MKFKIRQDRECMGADTDYGVMDVLDLDGNAILMSAGFERNFGGTAWVWNCIKTLLEDESESG